MKYILINQRTKRTVTKPANISEINRIKSLLEKQTADRYEIAEWHEKEVKK